MTTTLLRATLALCTGLALGAASAAPSDPSGLAVLALAREAAGASAWDRVTFLEAHGRIATAGLEGSWHDVEDLRAGRFAMTSDVGVYTVAEGFDGRTRWRQDPSGGVHPLDAPFSRAMAITDAWLARRDWLRVGAPREPDAGSAQVGAAEHREEGGRRYDVVTASPRRGQAVALWFDAQTHLLARSVRRMPISTQVVTYADYRPLAGLRLPFRIESGSEGSSQADVVTVAEWTLPADARFAPAHAPADTTLAAPTTVALEIDGSATFEARLNGQPFEFILDTGGHDIITPAVAAALGLQPVGAGESGGAGAGTIAQQDVRIETLQIGAATLRDQHFYVIPLQYGTVERGARPVLAGIIGLELFERLAVRIDYPARTMTLHTFAQAAAERRAGTAVPMSFDDDMPLVRGRIDGEPGLLALDTGNGGSTVVQGVWARRHGLADRLRRGIETVSYGAGGASRNWVGRLATLQIGDDAKRRGDLVLAHRAGRIADDTAGSFSSITEAANVGTDVLANFVVDVDYAAETIRFDRRPGVAAPAYNRSGLRATKDDPAAFDVALVTPGSPAAEAGLAKGDRIVAVDGVDALRMSGRDLAAKTVQAPGSVVELDVRRGDAGFKVRLTLRELLP